MMHTILAQHSLHFKSKLNYQPENLRTFLEIKKGNLSTLKKIRLNDYDVLTKVIIEFQI